MKAQWIFGLVLVLCATTFTAILKSWVSGSAQAELDKLAFLYCRSHPLVLTASVSGACLSERVRHTSAHD